MFTHQGLGLGNLDKILTLNQNPEAFRFSLRPVCFFNGCSFHCEITNVVQRCRERLSNGIGVITKPSAAITPTFLPPSHSFWPEKGHWFLFCFYKQFCVCIKLSHVLMEIFIQVFGTLVARQADN